MPTIAHQPPLNGPAAEAEQRTCAILTGLVADAWSMAESASADTDHQWSDFEPGFVALIRGSFPTLPPAAIALALRIWGRMHGVVRPHRPRSSSATEPSTKPPPANAPAQSGSSSTVAPITVPTRGVT